MVYKFVLNEHGIGRLLKESVRRAMVAIDVERVGFEVHNKDSYDGGTMEDVFTSADKAAQAILLHDLEECFPEAGIIGEEDSLMIAPAEGCGIYFTLDPLDGTRAFIRGQSHGYSTMIAMVEGQEVLSAYIGDIPSQEVFGYRPDSPHVHRITRLNAVKELTFREPFMRGESYALLRDPASCYTSLSQRLIETAFKSHNVDGGSIGSWAARLWKREVAALFVPPSWETPWDSSPVIGISRKLGYVFLRPNADGTGWEQYTPLLAPKKYRREYETVIVHQNDVDALLA